MYRAVRVYFLAFARKGKYKILPSLMNLLCRLLNNVFSVKDAGIVGSNPTQDMNVCLCLFYVSTGSGLATGTSPVQGVLPTVLGLRNGSETKRLTDALCSKVGATGKRERD
jgi:hypothetical protein